MKNLIFIHIILLFNTCSSNEAMINYPEAVTALHCQNQYKSAVWYAYTSDITCYSLGKNNSRHKIFLEGIKKLLSKDIICKNVVSNKKTTSFSFAFKNTLDSKTTFYDTMYSFGIYNKICIHINNETCAVDSAIDYRNILCYRESDTGVLPLNTIDTCRINFIKKHEVILSPKLKEVYNSYLNHK